MEKILYPVRAGGWWGGASADPLSKTSLDNHLEGLQIGQKRLRTLIHTFKYLFTQWEKNQPYLQGKELNKLVQIFFILRTQATLHVVMTFQSDRTIHLLLSCYVKWCELLVAIYLAFTP